MAQLSEEARQARNKAAREWRAANPDKVREAQRRYREAHPDKVREINRKACAKWRAGHREELAASRAAYWERRAAREEQSHGNDESNNARPGLETD